MYDFIYHFFNPAPKRFFNKSFLSFSFSFPGWVVGGSFGFCPGIGDVLIGPGFRGFVFGMLGLTSAGLGPGPKS